MILYAESSAVLRWLFNDALADQVFDDLVQAHKVACSRLTLIECRRAARRALSESRIAEGQLSEVLGALAQAAARWAVLELTPDVAERAGGRFPVEPVSTPDAIHLSSMAVLRDSLPDLAVLSTDRRLRENSAQLGFEVRPASLAG
jgi:hypothetical protein